MKHYRLLEERADAAGGPIAEDIPHAPPPYTSATDLHAGTATIDSYPFGPTSITSIPSQPELAGGPTPADSHRPNLALIIGAVLVGSVLLGIFAAVVQLLVQRNAKKLKAKRPRFSMLKPSGAPPKSEKVDSLSVSSSFGNFVFISNSEGEVMTLSLEKDDGRQSVTSFREGKGELQATEELPDIRRYSSPGDLGPDADGAPRDWLSIGLPGITASASAPVSPSLTSKDFSLHVQRQKAAELAQMVRMKFVREELPSTGASCPELSSPEAKRQSITHGLGIVHEESEVDIAGTAHCALNRYSVSFDPSSPTVPISKFFQVDKHGKVVRLASPVPSPMTPASDVMPMTPQWPEASDTGSIAEDDLEDAEDVNEAVIVRLGQTRSVEIKRGVLVSLHTDASIATAPPPSYSTPAFEKGSSYFVARPKSTSALPAPPTLSPIVTSPTSLSADIEETLEERVFAYRESGPWSKENYTLTTPGQVRALTEALALAKPHTVQHEQQPWPWPAHRSAFADLDDE